jgi:CubicO group peptidase (beta-lactamase class C family)
MYVSPGWFVRIGRLAAVLAAVAGVAVVSGVTDGGSLSVVSAQTGPQASLPSCQPSDPQIISQSDPILQNAGVQQVLTGFDQGFETQIRDPNQLPSVAVSIVHGSNVIWARGFGCADMTQQTAATAETIYGVGSVTKMFTAVMLMQLRDAGKLQLTDPVNMHVPGVEYQSPSGQTVSPTFEQLASHSSGLPDTLTTATTFEGLVQQLQSTSAESEPGTAYLYSNLGYTVLGQALAQIAGQPYEQYIADHILQPLGMSSSSFNVPTVPQAGYATPYISVEATSGGVQAQATTYQNQGLNNPAGGLTSTTMDMARFVMLQFTGGMANGAQIVSSASLQEMLQQVMTAGPEPLTGIGLGWQFYVPQQGMDFVGKDGFIEGFIADIVFVPGTPVGVFLVTNLGNIADPGNTPITILGAGEEVLARLIPAIQQAAGGQ